MSVNNNTMEQAEITFLFEKLPYNSPYRDGTGYGRYTVRQLPWCFVRYGDDTEQRKYVQPLPPDQMTVGGGIHLSQYRDLNFTEASASVAKTFGVSFIEFAEFAPFPYEKYRANISAGGTGSDDNIPGPVAIHFFGGV